MLIFKINFIIQEKLAIIFDIELYISLISRTAA